MHKKSAASLAPIAPIQDYHGQKQVSRDHQNEACQQQEVGIQERICAVLSCDDLDLVLHILTKKNPTKARTEQFQSAAIHTTAYA